MTNTQTLALQMIEDRKALKSIAKRITFHAQQLPGYSDDMVQQRNEYTIDELLDFAVDVEVQAS